MMDELTWNVKQNDKVHGMWSYEFLEIYVCWNINYSDDNALIVFLWDWWNYMNTDQMNKNMVVTNCCEYTCENEIEWVYVQNCTVVKPLGAC